ncbi:MAG: hypothetical protein DMF91_02685 [Acidobacteria bacterium]|nr:MAG: hypothetical protein DMF91_02685 [Acidobacteriota bacterium]
MGGTGGKGWTGRTGGKGRNERKSARGAGAALRLKGRRFMKKLRHHSLVTWQRANDLFIKLHQLTLQAFPSHERFELGSQTRRAAYSVPANIVEGMARRYRRARLHFLNIAESSLSDACLRARRAPRRARADAATA